MGYVMGVGPCINCGRVFSFNPHKVPSLRVNGVREPVCKECILNLNKRMKQKGAKQFDIPNGAYEAMPEEEL